MCLNPKKIVKKGRYLEDNYRGAKGDFYDIAVYSKCGCCQQCINEKCNNWVQRNYFETFDHEEKCFLTLTYRNNPVIVVRKDLQNFLKRFRRYLEYHENGRKIRMFGAMEYGELNSRPHAHIIVYGWQDKNAEYIGLNKKKNIIKKSHIIEKIWGLGITSYQDFNENEIPYIALYETPQDIFKKAYKLSRDKLKTLRKYAIAMEKEHNTYNQYTHLIEELEQAEKEMNEEKKNYLAIKEFNTWSIALGWRKFEEEYYKSNEFVFETYIQDKSFSTPSPWVKKLANAGNIPATEEMFRREKQIIQGKTESEEKRLNESKMVQKNIQKRKEWQDKRDVAELL